MKWQPMASVIRDPAVSLLVAKRLPGAWKFSIVSWQEEHDRWYDGVNLWRDSDFDHWKAIDRPGDEVEDHEHFSSLCCAKCGRLRTAVKVDSHNGRAIRMCVNCDLHEGGSS